MALLDALLACEGHWQGTSTLQDPTTGAPDDSSSSATVTPMLGGRFVRLDYTWAYGGEPQQGSLLVGADAKADTITAHWIDSWHMSDKAMACIGPKPSAETYSVRGSYPAPPGPDWGWRIDLTPDRGQTLRMVMFNVSPEAQQYPAVEARYTRA